MIIPSEAQYRRRASRSIRSTRRASPLTRFGRSSPCSPANDRGTFGLERDATIYGISNIFAAFRDRHSLSTLGPCADTGALKIAPHYPDSPGSSSWVRYLTDLNGMRSGGYSDYRPFTGAVSYVTGKIDANNINALITYLHSSASTLALDEANSDWKQPNGFSTYQIYPGGPTYTIPTVSNNLQSVTLGPDPMTNPLGIFYYNGDLTIKNGVTITGSLFCKGNLTLDGNNIQFQAVELPGLFGAGNSVRLPAIICNNLTVNSTVSSGSIKGLIAVFSTLTIAKASQAQSISIIGSVISKVFYIKERTPWDTTNWPWYYSIWWTYNRLAIPYFPVYMSGSGIGLNYQPLLTMNPDTSSITYHWPTVNTSVFLVNPAMGHFVGK